MVASTRAGCLSQAQRVNRPGGRPRASVWLSPLPLLRPPAATAGPERRRLLQPGLCPSLSLTVGAPAGAPRAAPVPDEGQRERVASHHQRREKAAAPAGLHGGGLHGPRRSDVSSSRYADESRETGPSRAATPGSSSRPGPFDPAAARAASTGRSVLSCRPAGQHWPRPARRALKVTLLTPPFAFAWPGRGDPGPWHEPRTKCLPFSSNH